MLQDYYQKASRLKKLVIKAGILYGAILVTLYTLFRAYYINFSPSLLVFSILLYIAELHTIILLCGFLYSLWPRKYRQFLKDNQRKDLEINMFITVAGEPIEVVKETIDSAKIAAQYYIDRVNPFTDPKVIVLNDGKGAKKENWKDIEDYCKEVGVYHVAREVNDGFKAGNINNGLKMFPSKNPHNTIDCFFDSDFCAKKEFLTEILKPLLENDVDFVQSPQRYKNLNTWVAKAAGAHQIFFFDFICPAKAYDNALFLCGTNYAIRREALLSTGGVDNRFVTEDYATSIKLHLIGKKGVFISKVLALGMAPMNLKEYFNQQTRWCKGCLDANGKYFRELAFGSLNTKQKFHYFLSTVYYFIGVRDLILVLAPLPYLFFGISLIRANTWSYLGFIYLPMVFYNFFLFFLTFQNPIKSLVLDVVSFPVFAKAFLSSVIGKNLPFSITIKKYERENPFKVYRVQLLVALILLGGVVYSNLTKEVVNPYGKFINHFWALYSASFLSIGFWLVLKENVSFGIVIDKKLPKFLNWGARYSYGFARISVILLIAFVVGMAAPIVYETASKEPQKLTENKYVDTAEALVYFNKKEELVVPSEGVYYGYYLSHLNSHPVDPSIKVIAEESPSLTMYYQDWNNDSIFDIEFMRKLSAKGVVPIITWEPFDSTNRESELNEKGAPQRLISQGSFDEYIRKWAKYSKAYKKPYFLRFAHEMNGNWYAWGNHTESGANEYINMWKHVRNIFEEEGATNAIWVWSPNNTDQYGKSDSVLSFYPGDEYVDWVAYSTFNWGSSNWKNTLWRNFEYMSYDVYNELVKLNKPIMVAETSSVSKGGDKTGWFYATLSTYIPAMQKIKAVILFNQNINNADFALDSGMDINDVITNNILNNDYYLKKPILTYK
ncbi:hypothetical protein A2771_00415 [Candidatus Woesebacteria bacterium RIFCSPHIGHO2_01_FULL_38_26b]|uniref:GH26 domain-containing protein n=1 Tax=Candidatus Woesebacteria bacterium RIFCSPHIGHO2_01_FULL_38_26b TaxID=1802491 RepID=A0A1F7Y045_9BACT|nr:MAG: hypothetical protein A2771_00415 [Candidatus Woesebacteria bacterium RIFCSPHIGHO2_01_FULL_38_26b]